MQLTSEQIASFLEQPPGTPTPAEIVEACLSGWYAYSRPHQRVGVESRWTNLEAGRGGGKTRCGSEHTLDIMELWGPEFQGAIGSQTRSTLRRDLITGPSGLIACARGRGYELKYLRTDKRIDHPSGATLNFVSGEVADDGRGLSINYVWLDELAHWQYGKAAFDNLDNALRAKAPHPGPHGLITSTPKRRSIITAMLHDPTRAHLFHNVSWSSYENAANIAKGSFEQMEQQYGNSWKARQEIYGEAFLDAGAVWSPASIDSDRFDSMPQNVARGLISIDPSGTKNADSDATGIVAIMEGKQHLPSYYVVADATVDGGGGREWALASLELHRRLVSEFDVPIEFLIEDNYGGLMSSTIMGGVAKEIGYVCPTIHRITAVKSKIDRADAAAVLYDQHRVHHCGRFVELEREMTGWVPGQSSPDRMDALVHGLLHLTKIDPNERTNPWYTL